MELDFLLGTFRPENTGLPFLMFRCSPGIFHWIDTKIRVHLFPEPVGTKRMLMESARRVAFTFHPDFESFL